MGPTIAGAAAVLLLSGAALVLGGPPPEVASVARSRVPMTAMAPASPAAGQHRAETASRGGEDVRYGWPSGGPVPVIRSFHRPVDRWMQGHRGVDLRLAPGSPVLSAADGVVVFAGPLAGRPVLSVLHPDGIRTTYEPVVPAVARGDAVRAGTVLGRLAAEGWHCTPEPCLHWGARRAPHEYLDPLGLVRDDVVIRLYPEP